MCHNFYLLEELRVNVAPILIDEIDEEFFSNKDRENNLIVNVSNLSTSNFDFTPCFIGTCLFTATTSTKKIILCEK